MSQSKNYVQLLCGFVFLMQAVNLSSFAHAQQQPTHKKMQSYVDSGGLRNYEIRGTDNNLEEALKTLDSQKGASIDSEFIFYTRNHSFKGTLIQTTSQYYVIAELERVNVQYTIVKKLHILDRSDVIGMTANFIN